MLKENFSIVFMGTGHFAVPILEQLVKKYKVDLVVCAPDKPVGRKKIITAPSIKEFALKNGLRIAQPEKIKNNVDFNNLLKKINPTVIVVASYGKILPLEILSLPSLGCLNLHGSILPEYRGPSPIQTALLNGETQTGVTLMQMDQGMDTGDMLAVAKVDISQTDDYLSLSEKLARVAAQLLLDNLDKYIQGELKPITQNNKLATYTQKIDSTMSKVDWTDLAKNIVNKVRAIGSSEGVYCLYAGKKLYLEKVLMSEDFSQKNKLSVGQVFEFFNQDNIKQIAVKCGQGVLILQQVKMEGKKSMAIKDFLNGQRNFLEAILR